MSALGMSTDAKSASLVALASSRPSVMMRLFPELPPSTKWKLVNLNAMYVAALPKPEVANKPLVLNQWAQRHGKQVWIPDPSAQTKSVSFQTDPASKTIVADLPAQVRLLYAAKQTGGTDWVCHTYGGFGEDRDALWFATGKPSIHLGVDFNQLPVGLSVRALTAGTVVDVLRDPDRVNGWGGTRYR
jgi:hypothetical protein